MRRPGVMVPAVGLLLASCLSLVSLGVRAVPSDSRVFTEPDAGVTSVVEFIDAAGEDTDGEVSLASSTPVLAALERAAARGVRVRPLLDEHPDGTGSAVPALVYRSPAAHGVMVAWSNPVFRYTHARYLVEPDCGQALICTCNLITAAFTRNRAFGVITGNGAQTRAAEAVCAADLTRTPVRGSLADLIVSPLNARDRSGALIASAHRTLDVYAEELNDPAQEEARRCHVKMRR